MNLWQNTIDPSPITFEDAVVSWYRDLLLHGCSATDTTGIENGIFWVFGVASSTNHYTLTSSHFHKVYMSMFYVCTCTLLYTFPSPFDKADPMMAFAEQLSWHREWRMQAQ
jgi:hypothetical protein